MPPAQTAGRSAVALVQSPSILGRKHDVELPILRSTGRERGSCNVYMSYPRNELEVHAISSRPWGVEAF
jgi:hypothetical protein